MGPALRHINLPTLPSHPLLVTMPLFLDSPDVPTCPCCFRTFKTTQGANAHISTSRSCRAYRKGKNPEEPYVPFAELRQGEPQSGQSPPDPQPEVLDDSDSPGNFSGDFDEDIDDIAFDLPLELDPWTLAPNIDQEPGPSSRTPRTFRESSRISRSLVEPEDLRHTVHTPAAWRAGHVFAVRKSGVRKGETDVDGDAVMATEEEEEDEEEGDSRYRPFSSELDWRIAQWAVADSASHAAFDRFLNIPGVSVHFAMYLNPSEIKTYRW